MIGTMNLQLILGEFSAVDALELIARMIHIKIRFHEERIGQDSSEEDIKFRESKIKQLQKELSQLRTAVGPEMKRLKLDAVVKVTAQ